MGTLAYLASTASGGLAFGQEPIPHPPSNDYAVDLYQGPILAPIRVTGLAGAYAGYAEGIEGFAANAASPALRPAHSVSWLELDIDASFSIPVSLFENNDFDNSGDVDADYSSFVYLTAGALLQAGAAGLGISGDLQRYVLTGPTGEASTVLVGRYNALLAFQMMGDQLVVGGGIRAATLGVSAPDAELAVGGLAPQFGFLVRPDWTPIRLGATYRHSVDAGISTGTATGVDDRGVVWAGNLVVPDRAELPWELEVGMALQIGPRPLNPRWSNPRDDEQELVDQRLASNRNRLEKLRMRLASLGAGSATARARQALAREVRLAIEAEIAELEQDIERLADERRARAANWPREHLLLSAELLMTGPVQGAIHLARFVAQGQPAPPTVCSAVASGEEINFSPRVGLEMEPVPLYVKTRFGTYYEPNRFTYEGPGCGDRLGRQHFTFGADLRLFSTTWFDLVSETTYKLQAYGDLAPRYQAFGLSLGVWR